MTNLLDMSALAFALPLLLAVITAMGVLHTPLVFAAKDIKRIGDCDGLAPESVRVRAMHFARQPRTSLYSQSCR